MAPKKEKWWKTLLSNPGYWLSALTLAGIIATTIYDSITKQ